MKIPKTIKEIILNNVYFLLGEILLILFTGGKN